MNSADQTANNRVACASVVTIPGQTNCDEFPLATTYQGAAFQPVWSAVAVPVTANSSQGGITNAFYKGNRVIDDDAFYVLAILSNGSISW
jgi:Deoxyribonuclease NucA/NucB